MDEERAGDRTLAVADGSIRVLLIDESAPGEYISVGSDRAEAGERRRGGGGVRLVAAGLRDGTRSSCCRPRCIPKRWTICRAQWIDGRDVRLTAPLVKAPECAVNPAEFVASAAGLTIGDPLKERAEAIYNSGRAVPASFDEFRKSLNEGGVWTDTATARCRERSAVSR